MDVEESQQEGVKMMSVSKTNLVSKLSISPKKLIIAVIVIAILGAIFLLKSFAAQAVVATLEGENMQRPASANGAQLFSTITDSKASGSKAGKLAWAQSVNGTSSAVAQVTLSSPVSSFTAIAHGTNKCSGRQPYMTITAVKAGETTPRTVLPKVYVKNTGWTSYSASPSLPAGTYTVTVKGDNLIKLSGCESSLYVDVLKFFGAAPTATPAPTLAFGASPTSITSGSSSTLTWTTTNAASCNAGGAWSGSRSTNGSFSTGALSTTSTYSLTCTGSGGTANASVTVNVSAVSTPPPTGGGSSGGNAAMIVGLDIGNFGSNGVNDIKGVVGYARLDPSRSAALSYYKTAGIKTIPNFTGNYTTSGVSGLGDPVSWASSTLSKYKSFGCDPTQCPAIEVLNEPGGTWFWGSNALSQTNADAYAKLVKAVYDAFHGSYGSNAPKILATYDGASGSNGVTTWGDRWWNSSYVDRTKVDGIIVHPYGGTSNRTASALGNTGLVTTAHTKTNKPIYVTEVGWPTAVGQSNTGDSFQWSEADQATNIYNFINWARGTGYVNATIIFNYRDYGTNAYYGITRPDGSHKPSYNALKCAAQSKPQNC